MVNLVFFVKINVRKRIVTVTVIQEYILNSLKTESFYNGILVRKKKFNDPVKRSTIQLQ